MTASEQFCLKWNDFQKNVSSSFKEIRKEFCDVTLVSEDYTKIEAHKVILAASSSFFRGLLNQSKHPHPLLYLRGVKGCHLSSVLDFMYLGEVEISQEELNNFLKVAEELELKGLTEGVEDEEYSTKESIYNKKGETGAKSVWQNQTITSQHQDLDHELIQNKINTNSVHKSEIDQGTELVQFKAQDMKTFTNYEQLDETINSKMHKDDGVWKCTECDMIQKYESKMKDHIEGKHIDGVSHSCDQCGKLFRSRNSLKNHKSVNHK